MREGERAVGFRDTSAASKGHQEVRIKVPLASSAYFPIRGPMFGSEARLARKLLVLLSVDSLHITKKSNNDVRGHVQASRKALPTWVMGPRVPSICGRSSSRAKNSGALAARKNCARKKEPPGSEGPPNLGMARRRAMKATSTQISVRASRTFHVSWPTYLAK